MSLILVIDDDAAVRESLGVLLATMGHRTIVAENGRGGLAVCAKRRPDIVITDVFMPEKDGFETTASLKRLDAPPKIIAISGGRACFLNMALALGADRALPKPLDTTALANAINELMRDPKPEESRARAA
jgi:CheY-like chemotaxis protein